MTPNDHRPWFDRMIWAALTVLTASFVALMLFGMSGCSIEKKMARDEAKAASILAHAQIRAAKLCPWCVFQDSVTTKADSAMVPMVYADVDTADLVAACVHVIRELQRDNATMAHLLANQVPDTVRVPVQSLSPEARKAVQAIRANVCQFEPLRYESDAVRVEVRPGANVPLLTVTELARTLPCPPAVARVIYKDPPRVKQWGWVGLVVGLVLGFGAAAFMAGSFRHK